MLDDKLQQLNRILEREVSRKINKRCLNVRSLQVIALEEQSKKLASGTLGRH